MRIDIVRSEKGGWWVLLRVFTPSAFGGLAKIAEVPLDEDDLIRLRDAADHFIDTLDADPEDVIPENDEIFWEPDYVIDKYGDYDYEKANGDDDDEDDDD